ncbi:hypothetical protein NPIL_257681 [Nephila pilipes]|uniref:Uncharacterized protein n=1 Tax=Nephila pilipes TaxID=299642 RepID=A0A8X6R458_NEPPI|nr:hypothetical protein NPIL_257681 [Nephila pilipes]
MAHVWSGELNLNTITSFVVLLQQNKHVSSAIRLHQRESTESGQFFVWLNERNTKKGELDDRQSQPTTAVWALRPQKPSLQLRSLSIRLSSLLNTQGSFEKPQTWNMNVSTWAYEAHLPQTWTLGMQCKRHFTTKRKPSTREAYESLSLDQVYCSRWRLH